MKTGIVICSYNMPEYTDALAAHIIASVAQPYDLMVFDNGSDLAAPSKYTTHREPQNIQMVPGFMKALDLLTAQGGYEYYWLLTTSCRFDNEDKRDPLELLLPTLALPDTYSIQPSLITDYGAWKDYLAPISGGLREVHSTDIVCSLFRADHFDGLGRWNEKLTYGWGVAAEIYYKARKAGLRTFTHDGYVMYHDTAIGYRMERMKMPTEERARLASEQADAVLDPIYGGPWREVLNKGLSWNVDGTP